MKFSLSDPLFRYVLGEAEKSPEATFTETELRKISTEGFEGMVKDKLLKYQQSDPDQETFPCPTPCEIGCDRVVGKIAGSYRAVCPEYSSVKPIILEKGDLIKYIFNLNRLIDKIRNKNQLVGSTSTINERIFFVGERSVGQKRVGVVLGLFRSGKEAESMLLGLSNRMPTYDRTIVLLPFLDKTSQDVLKKLESQNILVVRFEEAFPESDFAIDFARLEKKRPKAGTEYPRPSSKQQKDYDTYDYKCEDRLHFTGKKPKKRSNLVRLNEIEIRVPDNEMLLLIRLAMELKKGEGGKVETEKLYEEEITEEVPISRLFGRLRGSVSPGLLDRDGEKFIENDGDKSYRISTHPDFVIVKKNWLVKKYNELKEAVRKERERREGWKKRREEDERKPRS